ncbi:GNAT family N-acetyltransferase [Methanofollis fontis]|uniref:GNAT family N-acetyltransferase n=1 Tax=Methanofollis fontis TaxID=2052832 RepID=A0A483CU94_9EURY|nr:GNAT family N-acetyltransferase [Methanofollis fontis]TAJ44858.1 GNAT family N-acetyltransferase [Methanofollis fontis]
MSDHLLTRRMERADVDFAIQCARDEGWNPGIHDADTFFAQDPDGFFIAEADGEPVACSSMVRYGERLAFWGLLIVRPEYRGRGFGLAITKAAFAHAGDRIIGGDGVLAMQSKYRDRLGFEIRYRNIRYRGSGGGDAPEGLIPVHEVPFDDICAYDASVFSVPRPRFLRAWTEQEDSVGLVAPGKGGIAGYGVIRKCFEGHKIGPVFADSPAVASALLDGLAATVPGEEYFFDVPEPNPAAVALARERHMETVFETGRMYRGGVPGVPLERVFGVTTFELG